MALSNRKTTETTTAAGSFEEMDGDTTTQTSEKPAAEGGTFEPEGKDAAAPRADSTEAAAIEESASRALAEARSTALASPLARTEVTLGLLRDVIPPQDLEGLGFGVFPRITAALDGFWVDRDKRKLGDEITVEILSWNKVWLVVTGEKDNTPETNKLIRTSYDGVNLKGDEGTVAEYIRKLKAMEYDKATKKEYVEMYVNILRSAKDGVEPEETSGKIYQVSVSPQSANKLGALQLQLKMDKIRGKDLADTPYFLLKQESKTTGSNKFPVIEFSPVAKPA